jgi:hypothetical protein
MRLSKPLRRSVLAPALVIALGLGPVYALVCPILCSARTCCTFSWVLR